MSNSKLFGGEPIDYEMQLPKGLFDSLIMQESKWKNVTNKRSGAVGLGQIMQPTITDFNKSNKTNYTLQDMYDPQINQQVSHWYIFEEIPRLLNHFNLPVTLDNVLASYNFGIGNVKKGRKYPKETINYISNIKKNIELSNQGKLFNNEPVNLEE